MGQKETVVTGKNPIMIYGPKSDGTYIVEFRTAAGETLAISVPSGETAVLQHFQARMPYGLSCRTRTGRPMMADREAALS
jgi:hypothetical protein